MVIKYGPLPSVGKGVKVAVADGTDEGITVDVVVDVTVLLGETIGVAVVSPQAVSAKPMNTTVRMTVKNLDMGFSFL